MAKSMTDARALMTRAADHPTVKQFLRFALVGAAATVVHYAVLIALVELGGMTTVLATSLGFLTGATVSYFLNRKVTFSTAQPVGVAFIKYISALGVGLIINTGIVAGLELLGLHYFVAQPIATGVVLFWNFGASRLLVFKD